MGADDRRLLGRGHSCRAATAFSCLAAPAPPAPAAGTETGARLDETEALECRRTMSTEGLSPDAAVSGPSAPRLGESEAPSSADAKPGFAPRAIVEWGLIVASYVVLFFGPHWVGADGAERFEGLSQLLGQHKIPPTRYSIVGPFFSAPLWYLGKEWLKDPKIACSYYNWVLLGVFVLVLARLLKGALEPTTIRRFLLLLVAGSMFGNHIQAYYAEVFTAACVATGVLCVCLRRCAWLGWIAIVLGSANTPGVGVGAGAVCLYFTMDRRRLRYVLPIVAVVAIIAMEALLRKGGKTGYEGVKQNTTLMPYSGRAGFSYPLFLGLLSLVMSFGKGILFYAPGVFAPVRDLLKGKEALLKAYTAWLCFLAGLLVVYAKFCGWYGGQFWGPRYILFASVPACFALALNLGVRRFGRSLVALVMLTLSVWIGAEGALFGEGNLDQCWGNNYALEHLCWYVPEFSAWIRPFVSARPLKHEDYAFLTVYAVVYLYLATPVAIFLVRTALPRCKAEVSRWLDWRAWSF
jgi:hypothetical protein